PPPLGVREGPRRGFDLVDGGRGLRLPGGRGGAGPRRRRAPATPPPLRAAGAGAGVPRDRRPPQGRTRRAPRRIRRAHAPDRQGGRVDLRTRPPASAGPGTTRPAAAWPRGRAAPRGTNGTPRDRPVPRGPGPGSRRRSGRSPRTRTTGRSGP